MSESKVDVPVLESGPSNAPAWIERPARVDGDLAIFLREFLDDLPRGAVVLDLGSGPGSFDYRRRSDLTILATDILPLKPAERLPYVRWFRADGARLPLRAGSVDAVVAHYVLEHVTELSPTLDEIARVLRPGGRVYCSVPRATAFDDRFYRFAGYVAKYALGKFRKRIEHQQRFSFQSLCAGFYRRGFRLEGFATVPAGFSWMNDPRTLPMQKGFISVLGWIRRGLGLDLFREANFVCTFVHVGRRGERAVTHVCRRCGEHAVLTPPSPAPSTWICPWCGLENGLYLGPGERRRAKRETRAR
jgi:SAM-dependent methyltransferase